MTNYFVQVTLGHNFEDLIVKARNPQEALRKARKLTTIKHRFANFILG